MPSRYIKRKKLSRNLKCCKYFHLHTIRALFSFKLFREIVFFFNNLAHYTFFSRLIFFRIIPRNLWEASRHFPFIYIIFWLMLLFCHDCQQTSSLFHQILSVHKPLTRQGNFFLFHKGFTHYRCDVEFYFFFAFFLYIIRMLWTQLFIATPDIIRRYFSIFIFIFFLWDTTERGVQKSCWNQRGKKYI